MSVSIQTVEFERRDAYLSELDEGPPYTVHGVALGADDVTVGQSGIKKLWPAEELEKAADSLEGRSLVVDHNNDSDGVVGSVTKAGYKEGTGVIYQAELFDDELAEKISNGLLEVSIRGKHTDVEQMEETEEGAKVVEDIVFDNLSIVPTGAAPSNTIEIGETDELSHAELSAFTAELQEIEPGMWVKSDGMKGITISAVEDGEIEVDIYEEQDGQWRSTEETEMFDTNSLEEWDVDEEDVGPVEDEDEEEMVSGVPDNLEFDSKEDAMAFIEDEEILTGVHKMDGMWIPGADHDEYVEWERAQETDNIGDPLDSNSVLAAEGEKVQWDSSGGMARGVIVDRQTSGCFEERIDGDVKVCAEEGDPALLINVVEKNDSDKWKKTGTMVAHKESTVEETDFSMLAVDAPEFEDGMMVHWQVNPDMMGKIVHVDREKQIVMVEVMEEEGGEVMSSGFTVTAGYSDIEPVESTEQMSELEEGFDDYPEAASENAQMALDAREETDNPNDCGTDVGWKRANQLANGESLTREQVGKMSAFNRHRQNSEKSEEEGKADCGWMMWKAWGGDEGVDWAQNKLDSIEEEAEGDASVPMPEDVQLLYPSAEKAEAAGEEMGLEGHHTHMLDGDEWYMPGETHPDFVDVMAGKAKDDEELAKHLEEAEMALAHHMDKKMDEQEEASRRTEGEEKPINSKADRKELRNQQPERFIDDDEDELQDYEMHTPDWSGTTENEWSTPDMEDFDTEDLEEIAPHFLISATGFPPENFTDLKLPVVEPNGDLNVNALAAVKGGRGVTAVDGLGSDMEERIINWVNETANEEFDRNWGEEEARRDMRQRPRTVDDDGSEPGVQDRGPVDIALDLINKYLTIEGNHERDSVDNMLSWLMGSVDLPVETLGDFRMAARRFLDETPGTDSFSGMTIEQFRDWLLMHGHGSQGRREQDERDRMPRGEPSSVKVLTGDDLRQSAGKSEESELDDITTKVTNMTDDIEQKLAELSEPVAVEQDDLEELQQKADRFEEMSDTLSALKERTDVLDDVDREKVEELAEADEPVVVESARMEELEGEAEQVASTYASELAEELGMFSAEELTDKFSIEELREKYEEQIGDPAEELASSEDAEPKSGDVDEEELEDRADDGADEEELSSESDEAEEMRDELRNKILG